MDSGVTWRIYYDDGSVFTREDGAPCDAPDGGVQYVWQANGDHCFNETYYLWHELKGQWLDVDLVGLLDYLRRDAPWITAVRVGKRIPKAEWKALMARVNGAGR